jgi:hypothetical protein
MLQPTILCTLRADITTDYPPLYPASRLSILQLTIYFTDCLARQGTAHRFIGWNIDRESRVDIVSWNIGFPFVAVGIVDVVTNLTL